MERLRPGVHLSTYGQACMQCYKAKCRCVPSHNGHVCERCYRLRKDCQPSDAARRRKGQGNEDSKGRIAQLESKIESLQSAMQSIAESFGSEGNIAHLLDRENFTLLPQDSSRSGGAPAYSSANSSNSRVTNKLTPQTDSHSTGTPQTVTALASPSTDDPSSLQAEEHLNFFRLRMLPCFPFMCLPSDMSAAQLRRDRPTLYQAILTVTTFSTETRLARAEVFRCLVSTSAINNVRSDNDLLLGTLVYLTWSMDVFLGGADTISRFMMLAMSLIYDLRLFKTDEPDTQLIMTMTQGSLHGSGQNLAEETVVNVLERHRALLACYVLSSNISSHLGRQDALRWTSRMDGALRAVEDSKVGSTDEAFAFHVRLHKLKQEATYIRQQREADLAHTETGAVSTSVPGLLYLKSLRGQLHDLVVSFPPHLHQRGTLVTYAHYVELYINQLAYSMSWGSPLLDLAGQKSRPSVLPGYERLQCLWQSVENVKSWLDSFYEIHPSDLVGLPSHFWSQMVMCITVLKYLSTLGDLDWDFQAVRNTVNLISTLDCILLRLEMGRQDPALVGNDNLFTLLSRLLGKVKSWANGWMSSEMMRSEAAQVRGVDTGLMSPPRSSIPDLDGIQILHTMDLGNDEWFENMFGDSEAFS